MTGLLLLCMVAVLGIYLERTGALQAIIIRQNPQTVPWKVVQPEEVERGFNAPANTHIVIHMPESFEKISRNVLFGHQGEKVRYWGYCLQQNQDPDIVRRRTGLPGILFLSEAERAARVPVEQRNEIYNGADPLTAISEQEEDRTISPIIRHQMEVFFPRMLCYLMTAQPLSVGLDPDGDRFNDRLETLAGTDPNLRDTDGDGIWDSVEALTGTIPTIRDTDGDGIIDGIEDKNWNGRVDFGESDPRSKDTDRDGLLCDGRCRIRVQSLDRYFYLGEDLNLNGILDENETSPVDEDTDGDGILDTQEVLNCLEEGREEECTGTTAAT